MKKRYILNGFDSRELAQERNHEFALKHGIKPDATTKYMFAVHCLVKEQWGLEVNEEHLNLLDDSEKTPDRLREIPQQPFVNAYIPMLFRYLEKEYVDEFFKDGSLRLSSFKRFHDHNDEQRGDKTEGSNSILGICGNLSFMSFANHGIDAYVLSTSLLDDDQMFTDFKCNSGFVIEQPLMFMDEIAKQIPEFKGINYGPCLYTREKRIQRNVPGFTMEKLNDDDQHENMSLQKMFDLSNQVGGGEVLFSKLSSFAHQHEYRILWHSHSKPLEDFIDIKIPNAIKYCREIKKE